MSIFDICNEVHIGRIVGDRVRHEPNRSRRYFSHYASEYFMAYVIHTQIVPVS